MSGKRPQQSSVIHVWDDPDSKIQFLERTLHGKDWRTTIIYPDNDAASQAKRAATKASLEGRGYIVKEDIDDCGHATLQVHHIGDGTNLFDVYNETGLVKGTMHVGSHPTLPFRYLMREYQRGIDALGDLIGDPARANGLIYTFAEMILSFSGKGEKGSNQKSIEPFLLSLFGRLCLTQSLIYLIFSKTNDELAIGHLEKKFVDAEKHGHKLTDIRYDKEKDKEPEGIGHSFVRFIRKYPVQIGAVFNDLGMLTYAIYSVLHLRSTKANIALFKAGKMLPEQLAHFDLKTAEAYLQKGFLYDISRTIISTIAWSALLLTPKKHESKENEGIVESAWGKFRENPQVAAGVGTLASSTFGLLGASTRSNPIQAAGERLYLLGDFMLFFTKNSEYGGGHEQDLGKLGEKIAKYIHTLPVLLGPQTRSEFTHNIAQFVIEKDVAANQKTQISRVELDERVETLARSIKKYVETHNPHLDQVAEAGGEIASHFPKERRAEVIKAIAEVLPKLHGVYATPEELRQAIENSVAIAASVSQVRQSKLVQMKDINKEVAALAFAVPGLDAASSASAIYDALSPFTRAHPSDQRTLDQAMTVHAAGTLGIDPRALPGTLHGVPGPAEHTR